MLLLILFCFDFQNFLFFQRSRECSPRSNLAIIFFHFCWGLEDIAIENWLPKLSLFQFESTGYKTLMSMLIFSLFVFFSSYILLPSRFRPGSLVLYILKTFRKWLSGNHNDLESKETRSWEVGKIMKCSKIWKNTSVGKRRAKYCLSSDLIHEVVWPTNYSWKLLGVGVPSVKGVKITLCLRFFPLFFYPSCKPEDCTMKT